MFIPRPSLRNNTGSATSYRALPSLVALGSWCVGVLALGCTEHETPELARVGALQFGRGSDSRLSAECAECAASRCEDQERECRAEPSCAAEFDCRLACGVLIGSNECAAECPTPRDSAGRQTSASLQTCFTGSECTVCRQFVENTVPSDASEYGETNATSPFIDGGSTVQTTELVDAAVSGCTIPQEVTSECSLCAWSACCEQFAACNEPGPCFDAKDCFFDCYDACVVDCVEGDCNGSCTTSCQEQCIAEDYTGYAAFNARNLCGLTTECVTVCGGEVDRCFTCQEQCRDLHVACLGQPGCQEITLCVQQCGSDAGCVDRCFLDYESELGPFVDWLDCVSGLCGAECSP